LLTKKKPIKEVTPQPQLWAVYVDLNNDGDFLDAGETAANFVSVGGEIVTQNIIIPTTLTGPRRMRIKMQYMYSINTSGGSCGSFPSGEVEDYTINLTSAAAARTTSDVSIVSAKETVGNPLELTVYPNPATDIVKLSFTLQKNEKIVIIVYDLSGNIVINKAKTNLIQGTQTISLNTSQLKDGSYFIRVISDREVVGISRFIKLSLSNNSKY
jgi:hypothetical protein